MARMLLKGAAACLLAVLVRSSVFRVPRDGSTERHSIFRNESHPYHNIQPMMLCSDGLSGALEGDRAFASKQTPLWFCAWRLGTAPTDPPEHPERRVPTIGRRWVFHDMFARDGQLFAVVPQYLRMPVRVEQLQVLVRSERAGAPWEPVGHAEVAQTRGGSEAMKYEALGVDATVVRWRLPLGIRRGHFLHVKVVYASVRDFLRLWHADFLSAQMKEYGISSSSPPKPAHSMHLWPPAGRNSGYSTGATECLVFPGWDCLWPRARYRDRDLRRHPKFSDTVDIRPHRVIGATMMLPEDRDRYGASWAAFHGDRGMEAIALYRNDDEWLQGACLNYLRRDRFCRLAWPNGTALDAIASNQMSGAHPNGKEVCGFPAPFWQAGTGQCKPSVAVSSGSSFPVVLELSWPYRKKNNLEPKEVLGFTHESQPHHLQHFLYKYGKPLTEWMVNTDVDEFINTTSLRELVGEADRQAGVTGDPPPAQIDFLMRFTMASLRPSVESNFTLCPPEDLLLHPEAPVSRHEAPRLHRAYRNAGMSIQRDAPPDDRPEGAVPTRLNLDQARKSAWWVPQKMLHGVEKTAWPLLSEHAPSNDTPIPFFRQKQMCRTDLLAAAAHHSSTVHEVAAPAYQQWMQLGARSQYDQPNFPDSTIVQTDGDSIASSESLESPLHHAIQNKLALQQTHWRPSVSSLCLNPYAVLVHLLEQSKYPKIGTDFLVNSTFPVGESIPNSGETRITEIDGFGHLPPIGEHGCERRVRQALFLRGVGWGADESSAVMQQLPLAQPT